MKKHTGFLKSRPFRFLVIAGLFAFIVWAGYDKWVNSSRFDYKAHVDETAATVDGEPLTLGDLSYYVLLEERIIEEEARVYNPKSTRDYWNIRENGYIMAAVVKKTVLGMGVHDRIFYDAAVREGLTLTEEEQTYVDNEKSDFWEDLLDQQWEYLPVPEAEVNEQIDRHALAAKYQDKLAEEMGISSVRLAWNGYDYEKLLKADHKVRTNRKVWDRVEIGETTIRHTHVNFINGVNKGDKIEKKIHFRGFNMKALFGDD